MGGFDPSNQNADLPFSNKNQPATLPRVTQLIILNEIAPWVTTVKNDRGVTMEDVCATLWREYVHGGLGY
jgi:hypothetical protein